MDIKLTAGVVVRMIDKRKERDSDQCKARHGYVGGQWFIIKNILYLFGDRGSVVSMIKIFF